MGSSRGRFSRWKIGVVANLILLAGYRQPARSRRIRIAFDLPMSLAECRKGIGQRTIRPRRPRGAKPKRTSVSQRWYADAVRHITRCWIPFAERRGLEDVTPGPTAYPAAKVKGDRSMPSKRERSEDADDPVPQGPRDTVRTELFELQPPTMQAYIPRHSVLRRGHRDRAAISSSLEPSTRWAMGHHPIQGGERGTYVALDTSSTTGMWDRPTRREAQGDGAAVVLRGRESRPHGEGRQVS